MIIVKLMGGLGNQIFQYAAGRRLAHSLGVDIKLDISWFEKNPLRYYALGAFNIVEHFASPDEVLSLSSEKRNVIAWLAKRVLPAFLIQSPTHIKERHFHFDKNILSLPDNVYLNGYWQSEKYFLDISNIIRKEFTVKFQQSGNNLELAKEIASCESVSIHVRRGDYVFDPHTNKMHSTCDVEYYICCVDKITQSIENPHFFIFSDDPKWVRKNINLAYSATIVDHNGDDKSFEDLRLMSMCKHHIIANSSFSWWGAWLNDNPGKIVVAPKKWFADEKMNNQIYDLIPEGWTRI